MFRTTRCTLLNLMPWLPFCEKWLLFSFWQAQPLKICSKFIGEHTSWSVISIKIQITLESHWNGCFPVYFQNTFYCEHLWRAASVFTNKPFNTFGNREKCKKISGKQLSLWMILQSRSTSTESLMEVKEDGLGGWVRMVFTFSKPVIYI